MCLKSILVFLILIGFTGTSFSIPFFSDQAIYDIAEVIVKGQVISYIEDGSYRVYEIEVHEYLKNPKTTSIIKMKSIAPHVFNPHDPYSVFEKGDYVFAYLSDFNENDQTFRSTNFSHKLESLDSKSQFHTEEIIENNLVIEDQYSISYEVDFMPLVIIAVFTAGAIGAGFVFWNSGRK